MRHDAAHPDRWCALTTLPSRLDTTMSHLSETAAATALAMISLGFAFAGRAQHHHRQTGASGWIASPATSARPMPRSSVAHARQLSSEFEILPVCRSQRILQLCEFLAVSAALLLQLRGERPDGSSGCGRRCLGRRT